MEYRKRYIAKLFLHYGYTGMARQLHPEGSLGGWFEIIGREIFVSFIRFVYETEFDV